MSGHGGSLGPRDVGPGAGELVEMLGPTAPEPHAAMTIVITALTAEILWPRTMPLPGTRTLGCRTAMLLATSEETPDQEPCGDEAGEAEVERVEPPLPG